jgi:hypothetical protein
MTSLLEVLITFVSAMLILALVAQSVQEVIKVIFAIKAATARRALEGLLAEAAQAEGLLRGDGTQVVDAIVKRLSNLGQNGVRPGALRLDTLNAPLLGELICSLEPEAVASLKGLSGDMAVKKLEKLAGRAMRWFPLAMDPVDERYRRRMRALSLLSAAIVVVSLKADAFGIIEKARHDPAFRARIQLMALQADSLDQRRRAEAVTIAAADSVAHQDTTGAGATAAKPRPQPVADSAHAAFLALLKPDSEPLFGGTWPLPGHRLSWFIGIAASVLLVSLGAPFWHDALETLFGVKNRIRAQAEKVKSEALPTVETVRTRENAGGQKETKVTTKPVPEL